MTGVRRARRVEHADPAASYPAQLADAVLDALERPPYVQTAEDEVASAGGSGQPGRLGELCSNAAFMQSADDELVRPGRAFRDHAHAVR